MRTHKPRLKALAAALIALAMLSYACVQAAVMQAGMAPGEMWSAPLCGAGAAQSPAMAGMDMGGEGTAGLASAAHPDHADHPTAGHKTACPYCAAAAHLPVMASAQPLRTCGGFVFAAFRVVASHGPRGPPAFAPRARGPPEPSLTA